MKKSKYFNNFDKWMQRIIITIGIIAIILLTIGLVSAVSPYYTKTPSTCPKTDASIFPGQSCSPINFCGNIGGIAQCYDTSTITMPSTYIGADQTNVNSGIGQGYVLDCYNPATCTSSFYCSVNSTCETWNRYSNCTTTTEAHCLNYCKPNYYDCDGDPNTCEVLSGSACTIGGLPGTYSGCTCVTTPQHFITNTEAKGSAGVGSSNLWGTNYGAGLSMNLTNILTGTSFLIDNESCMILGGSRYCNSSDFSGGNFWRKTGETGITGTYQGNYNLLTTGKFVFGYSTIPSIPYQVLINGSVNFAGGDFQNDYFIHTYPDDNPKTMYLGSPNLGVTTNIFGTTKFGRNPNMVGGIVSGEIDVYKDTSGGKALYYDNNTPSFTFGVPIQVLDANSNSMFSVVEFSGIKYKGEETTLNYSYDSAQNVVFGKPLELGFTNEKSGNILVYKDNIGGQAMFYNSSNPSFKFGTCIYLSDGTPLCNAADLNATGEKNIWDYDVNTQLIQPNDTQSTVNVFNLFSVSNSSQDVIFGGGTASKSFFEVGKIAYSFSMANMNSFGRPSGANLGSNVASGNIEIINSTTGSRAFFYNSSGSNNNFIFYIPANFNDINASHIIAQQIGIGIDPSYPVHVYNPQSIEAMFENPDATSNLSMIGFKEQSGQMYLGEAGNRMLIKDVSYNEIFNLTSAGDLWIKGNYRGNGSLLEGINASFNQGLTDTLYYSKTNPLNFLNKTQTDLLYSPIGTVGGNASFNQTLTDSLYASKIWGYNMTTPAINYAIAHFMNRTGDSVTGTYDFNGGWLSGGLTISGGNLYAQTLYVYNISSINVATINTNGSIIPTINNQFDLGSLSKKWKNAYFSGTVNGTFVGDGSGLTGLLWGVSGLYAKMSGAPNIDMQSRKIVNVTNPTDLQDVATKDYVDNFVNPYISNNGTCTIVTGSTATLEVC